MKITLNLCGLYVCDNVFIWLNCIIYCIAYRLEKSYSNCESKKIRGIYRNNNKYKYLQNLKIQTKHLNIYEWAT